MVQQHMSEWHVITSEYPPQTGGVSDYTHTIAAALAASGDETHVWCPYPGTVDRKASRIRRNGVERLFVHEKLGRFSATDLRKAGSLLDQFPSPRRLLVQWVPHGYGFRSVNIGFCLWLWHRATFKRDRIELMVHEPFLAFGEGSTRQDLAATAHRAMIIILLNAAHRVWVSIPDWETQLRPFLFGRAKPFQWLPVPSNIPASKRTESVDPIRAQYVSSNEILVGHFGAYDQYMADLMLELLPALLARSEKVSILLIGKGSSELRRELVERYIDLAERVHATDTLPAEDVSRYVSACDLMLQPYQDGVSGRRTSVMTALSHGIPVVSNFGKATESCWSESQAVLLTRPGDIGAMVDLTNKLFGDATERRRLGVAGRALYEEKFDVARTVAALRHADAQAEAKTSAR